MSVNCQQVLFLAVYTALLICILLIINCLYVDTDVQCVNKVTSFSGKNDSIRIILMVNK